MSQQPPDQPRSNQEPIQPRSTAEPVARPPSERGPSPPKPDRSKIVEGLLSIPKSLVFLLQVFLYVVGWLLFQTGRLLINVSQLREQPAQTIPGSPPSPPRAA